MVLLPSNPNLESFLASRFPDLNVKANKADRKENSNG